MVERAKEASLVKALEVMFPKRKYDFILTINNACVLGVIDAYGSLHVTVDNPVLNTERNLEAIRAYLVAEGFDNSEDCKKEFAVEDIPEEE